MIGLHRLFVAAATLASVAQAAPSKLTARAAVPPSQDSFYNVPANISDYAPGSIIAHRDVPQPIAILTAVPVNLKYTQQVLYRTTDNLDQATATVLTVLVPQNADPNKLLSYQFAEDSSCIDCAPSYVMQLSSDKLASTPVSQLEVIFVQTALAQGFVVIVPDFEGPQAAYLANKLAGRAVLDGIRAAKKSGSFSGIPTNPRVAMWGYSGGSLASMFAAEQQATYAPDVKFVGAAVGGTVPSIYSALDTINGGKDAGLIPGAITGLANQYPRLQTLLEENLKDDKKDAFFKARTQCLGANEMMYMNQDMLSYFKDHDFLKTDPEVRSIITDNDLGKATPVNVPMYVYKAVHDDVSPVADTDALVKQYCAGGAQIQYVRDELSNHVTLAITGVPGALEWLSYRLAGIPARAGCSTKTELTQVLDPEALGGLPKVLIDGVLGLLGNVAGLGGL